MHHIPGNLVLENERVLLRKLKPEDAGLLMPFAMHEPGLWLFSLTSAAGEEGMNNYIRAALSDADRGFSYPFIVFDKKLNRYAGSTRYYDINPEQQSLQLGYTWYGKDFQGTGLNKNCKYLLLQYAFETLQAERVEFRADADNKRSVAAMKAIGCTAEGILRNHLNKHGGGRRNSIILSILRNEWFETIRTRLQVQIKNLL